ncbi:MAG: 50S ribosomal protein L23, partial [Planctomycetes bacterium]|nr:50S ribosomal protein L23 [Planctomycetota bacterium]
MADSSGTSDMSGPQHIIKGARVTEKTTHLSQRHNCYVIEVSVAADKLAIKRAVEELWSVRVLGVRTQMRIGKRR